MSPPLLSWGTSSAPVSQSTFTEEEAKGGGGGRDTRHFSQVFLHGRSSSGFSCASLTFLYLAPDSPPPPPPSRTVMLIFIGKVEIGMILGIGIEIGMMKGKAIDTGVGIGMVIVIGMIPGIRMNQEGDHAVAIAKN